MLRKPNAVRPWQFVLDAVSGLLLLTEAACRDPQSPFAILEFRPDRTSDNTVASVADALARHWGESASWRAAVTPGIPETMTLEIDSSKAVKRLGWQPRWPLDVALAQTVSWYRAFYAGENMLETTSQKIDDYCFSNATNIRIARSSL